MQFRVKADNKANGQSIEKLGGRDKLFGTLRR
jgi:hypothetical protein